MTQIRKPAPEAECVSVAEAAVIAGLSESFVYRLIADGQFPHKRIRKRIVVPLKRLREWLDTP